MSGADPGTGDRKSQAIPAHATSGDDRRLPWLLGQKIAVPKQVVGHLDRTELVERVMPTRRRLTVLQAPAGFGKTTLLAECCRRLRDEQVRVAWVSVDEQDEPGVLDTYIAYACQCATTGAPAKSERVGVPGWGVAPGGRSRTALAMHAISDLDEPFVLVFDEVERLQNPDSLALLEFLLQRGPSNLHLVIAGRQLPAGVHVAGAVLDGHGAIFSAEDLRFSHSEVAAFFDGELTSERLSAVMSESAGWPFALRVSRNEMMSGRVGLAEHAFVENWMDTRLFGGLSPDNREFLLDIGLFEWIDAALLDEALERSDSMHRIGAMSVLVGMLEPVHDGASDVWRLHPLIREYSVRRRFRDTPQRFRAIHRRIAEALERRGHTAQAIRHAVEAGEMALAGEMLERAGGVRLNSRMGPALFQSAERLLSEDVVRARPRLALSRCLSLMLSGRMTEAVERYRSTVAMLDGREEDGSEEDEVQLAAESCMVRGMLTLYGGVRFGSESMRTHLADVARLAESPVLDSLTRGAMEYSLVIAGSMTARFEDALDHAARARQLFARNSYMSMYVHVQEGQVAMAQGRARNAGTLYRRARRFATSSYVLGPEPAATCTVLALELGLECGVSAEDEAKLTHMPEALATGGSPLQVYAAASGVLVDLKLRDEGVASALTTAEGLLAYVRDARLPALVRHVSALRISVLATAGRIDDGERAWKSDGLPEEAAECLDLEGQTWREMESLSCARLRLAIGGGRFDEAREFAEALRTLTAARGLTRTLMRALALSIVLEVNAGETVAAAEHLEAYLRLYAKTPYAGPLVRERETCTPIVTALVDAGADTDAVEAAQSILAAMEQADAPGGTVLDARELDVLQRLTQSDKKIAGDLGLGVYGVRHHIRKLFTKLGVRKREDAVRRAREMGLLPDES